MWEALLDRFWSDGGTALGELVTAAARDDGPAGHDAVRLGLETIGAGLVEGDPSDRTVSRARRRGRLAGAGRGGGRAGGTGGRPRRRGVRERRGKDTEDLLKGLGYVTVDRPRPPWRER